MKRKLEVLAPAGDLERVQMAVSYGADAVYLSGPGFGMRPAGRMSVDDVARAAELCHEKGAKLYITCNTTPTDAEMRELPDYLRRLAALGADAVIVGDVGVLATAREVIPDMAVHVSTQTGVMNSVTARTLASLGASRVIPAREMTMENLRTICAAVPEGVEIEAFVHGSMCVSFSGRCLLSNYLASRDVNTGNCAQPCRWKYALMEERRPGEYFPIEERENGTYILNSRDMCLIEHVRELYEAGVSSIKIEGRTKSAYYVATVVNAYRHAADAAMEGRELDPCWRAELDNISHRPYSTGFLFGQPGQHTEGSDYFAQTDFIAVVDACDADGNARLHQRNKFSSGEELELLIPGGDAPVWFVCGEMTDLDGFPVPLANLPMQKLLTKLPLAVPPRTIVRRRRRDGEQVRRRKQP